MRRAKKRNYATAHSQKKHTHKNTNRNERVKQLANS